MKIIIDTGQDGKVINARVRQKTATLSQWLDKDPVILDGEQAFIIRDDGTPLNFRIGDGSKKFSELPDWVAYEQGTYVPVAGSALPTLGAEIRYTWVGPGTYTQSGGPDIVVPSGYMGVLSWDGSVWSLSQSAELPEVEGVDVLDPLGEGIPKEIAVAKYAASKDFLGIVDISDGSDIGYMLKAEHSGDSDMFEPGFLRPNGSIGESSSWITTKNYIDILPGYYSSNLILQGNSSLVIYDIDKEIIQVVQDKGKYDGSEDWQVEVVEGARYFKTSRSIGSISAPVDFHFTSIGEKSLVTDKTFIPSEGYEDRVSEAFESRGFIEIQQGENMLSELTNSDLDDPLLWGVGFLHYNGTIVPGGNWRYSIKKYRVYPGKYILQSYFSGNAVLWVSDIDGNVIRMIENDGSYAYSSEVSFSANEAYLQISFLKSTTSTSWIECSAVDKINYFSGSSSINLTSSIKSNDVKNAVNGFGIARGILSSLASSVKTRSKFPVVTFISDDIHIENFNWYLPLLDSNGVKGTFAFITDRAGVNPDYATDEHVLDLYRDGHDIASHTRTHKHTADLTEDEQVEEIAGSKIKIMNIIGDNCPVFIPPFGSQSLLTESIVRQYYDLSVITVATSTVATGECCNNSPIDTYRAKRVSFDAGSSDQSQRLQLCKDAVDVCFDNSEWLIFAIHPQYPEYSETSNPDGFERRRQDLTDLIEYIKSKNIPIMTAKNALSLWGNPLELGGKRLDDNYYYVGMDGSEEGDYFQG